jgi:hypothetical protein
MIEMRAKIAKRVWCRLSWDGAQVSCEWDPKPQHLTRQMKRRYYAARHEFLKALAEHEGITVAVLDA